MTSFINTRAVVTYLCKYISGKTLDYGAGTAKYRKIIIPHTREYITFDMVRGENVDVVGDAHKPPFEDESFDTVISTQMFEHIEKPWVVASEIKRILKPNGVCIITAPFIVPYHADPHDFFRYTKEGLESLFKNEGFKIEESGTYGKALSVLGEMIHFSFFSHYKKRSKLKEKVRSKIIRLIKLVTRNGDPLLKGSVVYANSYIVARKIVD